MSAHDARRAQLAAELAELMAAEPLPQGRYLLGASHFPMGWDAVPDTKDTAPDEPAFA